MSMERFKKKEQPAYVERNFKFTENPYTVFVLFMMLAAKMINQWQRKFISYATGYSAPTDLGMMDRSFYEIGAAYPQLEGYYGLLSGLAYTLPYSLFTLIFGSVTNSVNRKLLLAISLAGGACTQLASGFFNSFYVLCGARMLHGAFNSASSPLTYSLVADYVPPERRATANAFLGTAVYTGISLSSLSILLIKTTGWRYVYYFMGAVGLMASLVTAFFVREPEKG